MQDRSEQTICAISTPHGVGGIAVIRVSGTDALDICKKIAPSLNSKKIETHRVYFSNLVDLNKNKVDEALLTYFANGKSFTGEEVVEISCHGSKFITQQILDLLIKCGCRMADKGEFTFRAFMNGKLDLVQAESVLSLIESQNQAAARLALRQLDGYVSKEIDFLISELTWCLANIEASIDFIEQGIEVVDTEVLMQKLKNIQNSLQKLILSYQSGRLVKDGVKVALIGRPNVGKSSLLNLLVQNDKAIVTPIAGTTRDVIEAETLFDGIKYNFSDTAGLRETEDQVEKIGINRSHSEAEKADLLCFVFDAAQDDWKASFEMALKIKNTKKLFLFNKSDLLSEEKKQSLSAQNFSDIQTVFTSALRPESREQIFVEIQKLTGNLQYLDEAVISTSRQYEQALYSFEMISKSVTELEQNLGAEFVSMYLKEALISMQKTLGQVYDDQIMDRVFKEFCLGK